MPPTIGRFRAYGCHWPPRLPFAARGLLVSPTLMSVGNHVQRLIAASALWLLFSASAQSEAALELVQAIPLPNIAGRIDHFAIDVKGRRAFLAALTKNTVEVVDLKVGQAIRTLPGFAKPQGVLFVPELNKLFVAAGMDGALKTSTN